MPRERTPMDPSARAVLVMRALPGLGDLLCATPALRALRAALPRARITLLGLPCAREWVARYPHLVDEFVEFPGAPGLPEAPVDPDGLARLRVATQGHLDLALQMHGDGTFSNAFIQRLGARRTAGFYAPPRPCPDPTAYAPYPEHQPEPRRWLTLLDFLGAPAQGEQLEFPVGPDDRAELDDRLDAAGVAAGDRLVVLHAGASAAPRRLEPRVLAPVADGLAARGLRVVLTGTPHERPLGATLRRLATCEPIDLTGRTSIGALAALLARARLVVVSDTGVSHLASALRTASVVVFLASDVQRWAPLDRDRHRIVDGTKHPPDAARILAAADAALAAGAPRPEGFAAARRVLLVPPARGPADLGPALHRLRAALPDATLVLLSSAPCPLVDAQLQADDWTQPAVIERLAAADLDAAIVFTDEHESALEPAYLGYLAGVPLRAGLAAEFGGGVLTLAPRPPPYPLAPARRHLFLLRELGL